MTSFDIKIEWVSPLKINSTIRTYTMDFSWTRKHKNGQRNVIVFHISYRRMISKKPHN